MTTPSGPDPEAGPFQPPTGSPPVPPGTPPTMPAPDWAPHTDASPAPGRTPGGGYAPNAGYVPGTGYAPNAGYAPGVYYAEGAAPVAPRAPVDPLAVAAVPAGLFGPLGVGLGISALVRTRTGTRRGRGLAVLGTVLGMLTTLGTIVGAIALIQHAADWRQLPVPVTAPTTAHAVQLTTGHCIDRLPDARQPVDEVLVVPCANTHHGQVVAQKTFTGFAMPRASDLTTRTAQTCPTAVTGDTLPEGATVVVLTPTAESWAQGDRTGLCVVHSANPLPGDLLD